MSSNSDTDRVVAHLLPWPAVGGTEHATLRIAQAVRQRGFESVAFCLPQAAGVQALFADHGFETVKFEPPYASVRHGGAYLRSLNALRRALKARRVDVLHCADVMGALYAAPAGKLARIPVICHVRNQFDTLTRRERVLLSAVDSFAFVSRDTWQRFSYKVDPAHGRVLYDAVQVAGSRDPEAVVSVRRELQISPATLLVGMVARVSPQKDYFTLARAAARVVQRVPDVRFVVVGDISEEAAHRSHYEQVREELARLGVDSLFIFTGFRSDVTRLMNAFDVAVLSTNWEGLPLVVLESMALGVPTIATSVNGIPEIIPRPEVGLLSAPGDDAELAHHLITVLSNADIANRIGAAGRSFVQAAFSPKAFSDNLVAMYEDALGLPE